MNRSSLTVKFPVHIKTPSTVSQMYSYTWYIDSESKQGACIAFGYDSQISFDH